MLPIEAGDIRGLIEAAVTAISVLGGTMAARSGLAASNALSEDQPSSVVSERINEGIGEGFSVGTPMAVVAFIILLWT
jgi:hypothetical protein